LAALEAARAGLEERGVSVVAVGIGSPADARAAREATGYAGLLLADSSASLHRVLALRRVGALRHLFRLRALREALRARKEGHRQVGVTGDPAQQGGTFALGPGRRVLYAWRNAAADDDAPIEDVVEALSEEGISSRP
jgi:hypothetical protein